MTDQTTLELAYADRRAGQAANLAAGTTGHRDDRTVIEIAVAVCARNNRPFTADDVHQLVRHERPDGYDRNLVSSVMGTWAQAGRIVRELEAGLSPSRNRSRKGSRNSYWRGARDGKQVLPCPA
ncbi:hypothetical protein SAMN05216188_11888 [Lentzea xinjiangensis]|uniref:Uncharacterized protein n=1 Tax=Lentzea xinjiangensis TaxID=402600 RepID=A0A1H9TFL0_9PSEU|nr:hypothetical protein [Lentzea xinjiangensis]SER95886.1 hypothetical protein SAMN05216188_11888 [Lentzea xinjiangensis]